MANGVDDQRGGEADGNGNDFVEHDGAGVVFAQGFLSGSAKGDRGDDTKGSANGEHPGIAGEKQEREPEQTHEGAEGAWGPRGTS